MNSRPFVIPTLVVLTVALSIGARAQDSPLAEPAIHQILVDRIDRDRRSLGMVVGVITPEGRRVVSYGRRSANDAQAPDGNTVFEIGSVSKVFTAWLLADMVNRGEVTLADPIERHLPPTVRAKPNTDGKGITLVDLATHTAGFPFWPSNLRPGELREALAAYTTEDLYQFVGSFEVPPTVGSRWAYSNADAGLLGLLLARRVSTSYEALLRDRLTTPLELTSTVLRSSSEMQARLASGHTEQLQPAPPWNVPAFEGGGSIQSTVADILTFLESLGQSSASKPVLPIMLGTRRAAPGVQQALGWMVLPAAAGDIIFHDGQTLGFASAIAYEPKTRTGVVVLSNAAASVGDIARHVLRPSIPLAKAQGAAPVKTEIAVDPAIFDRYTGRYVPKPGLEFVVTREGTALMLQIPGLPQLRIRPEREHQFFVAENTRLGVAFDVDASGEVTGLVFTSPGGPIPAARVRRE